MRCLRRSTGHAQTWSLRSSDAGVTTECVSCRAPWPAQLEVPVQAAARHPTFISDTIFSSPANITTIDYVNGSSVLVYSSAPAS